VNKKLVLSVLSTAVLTSMAASAMAAPSGYYVGGNVDKIYSTDFLIKNFKEASKDIMKNPSKTVFVDEDGKAVNFMEAMLSDKNYKELLKPATKSMFEDNEYVNVATGEKWDPKKEEWPEVPGDLTVESVSAITAKTVKVTFDKDVTDAELKTEDFQVVEKGNEYGVLGVNAISKNGNEVTLTLVADLNQETVYNLKYKGEVVSDKDITYVKAVATEVQVTTTKVPTSGTASLKAKVLAGTVDVTEDFTVTWESDNASAIAADGTVNTGVLTAGEVVLAKAKITQGGKELASQTVTITAEDREPATFSFFNIDASSALDSTLKAEDAVTSIKGSTAGNYIEVYANDQFGDLVNTPGTYKFSSKTPNLLLVDAASGQIKGIYGTGTAYVEVTAGEFKRTIAINITDAAIPNQVELSSETVDLVTTGQAQTITISVKDQYGKVVEGLVGGTNIDAFLADGDDEVALSSVTDVAGTTDGKYTFTVTPKKEGAATIYVTVGTGDKKVTKSIAVNVAKAGSTAAYGVFFDGNDTTIDAKTSETLTYTVYPVDASGKPTSKTPSDVSYYIQDKDGNYYLANATNKGKTKTEITDDQLTVSSASFAKGTYKVTVVRGTLVIGTSEFTVVDTSAQLSAVDFANKAIVLDESSEVLAELNKLKPTVKDQFGKEYNSGSLTFADIDSVTVEDEDVFTVAVNGGGDDYETTIKTSGKTFMTVVFNTVDANGKAVKVPVAFQVTTKIDTEEELNEALANSTNIVLAGNIVVSDAITLDSDVTIDGKGFEVSGKEDASYIVLAASGANVKLKNIKITNTGTGESQAINVNGAASFALSNSTVKASGAAVYSVDEVTISGTTFINGGLNLLVGSLAGSTVSDNNFKDMSIGILLIDGSGAIDYTADHEDLLALYGDNEFSLNAHSGMVTPATGYNATAGVAVAGGTTSDEVTTGLQGANVSIADDTEVFVDGKGKLAAADTL
jgi:hypothetical protein